MGIIPRNTTISWNSPKSFNEISFYAQFAFAYLHSEWNNRNDNDKTTQRCKNNLWNWEEKKKEESIEV